MIEFYHALRYIPNSLLNWDIANRFPHWGAPTQSSPYRRTYRQSPSSSTPIATIYEKYAHKMDINYTYLEGAIMYRYICFTKLLIPI